MTKEQLISQYINYEYKEKIKILIRNSVIELLNNLSYAPPSQKTSSPEWEGH